MIRRLLATLAIAAMGCSVVIAPPANRAIAMGEINWFVAAHGLIRTDVVTSGIDVHPETGLVYAVVARGPATALSSLNVGPGDTRANLVVTGLTGQAFQIYNHGGGVDVVVDVLGVYVPSRPGSPDGRFFAVDPFRRFDSRASSPFPAPGHLVPDSAVILSGGTNWTTLLNVAAVDPSENGFLSVVPRTQFSHETFRGPATSNVNFRAGDTVANAAYAAGSPDYAVYNAVGNTHVVVDVFGYFQAAIGTAADAWR